MSIFQDSKNNYWFGSWETGVYLYDGHTVQHFTTADGLPSNRVETVQESHDGRLFFLTSGGIAEYNGKTFIPLKEVIRDSEWALQPNNLWFKDLAYGGSALRFDGHQWHSLKLPKVDIAEEWISRHPNLSSPYDIYTIYKDSKGNIWFGMALAGVLRYDGTSFDWITEDDVTEFHYGPANGLRSIAEDTEGYFWFNSAYRYAIHDTSKPPHRFYTREKSIGSLDGVDEWFVEFLSNLRDTNGHMWMVSYMAGIYKYDGKKVTHYPVKSDGADISTYCIYQDRQGSLWVGTHETGVYKFNGTSFERFWGPVQ